MNIVLDFFKANHNLYIYLLFIVNLLIFASVSRVLTYLVEMLIEKSSLRRRGIAGSFTPFLILFFIIAGESTFFLLFRISGCEVDSFSFFLNSQIIWAIFWLVMVIIKVGLYGLPQPFFSLRKFYQFIRILLLLILLTLISAKNLNHIISILLGFLITFLLLRVSYTINQIPLVRKKFTTEEEEEKIIARWDMFNITLPYNISKDKIDKAIEVAENCVKKTENIGNNFSVLLKDLSERGIVIEVKYLVLDSTKMKKTRHNILSLTLNSFAKQGIPMSSS